MSRSVIDGGALALADAASEGLGSVGPVNEPERAGIPRILVIGGGYVGMYTALRLQRRLRRHEAAITVVSPQSYMTYQPFLPEAAAGSLEPRHVVVPLRRVLRGCRVLSGAVTRIEHARRAVHFEPIEGPSTEIGYELLVIAVGSVSKVLPIPGLAEVGIGFKTVAEAIWLRNHVLARIDAAASTADVAVRRRALTFVVVGGGYAGVEALAELEDMARYAVRFAKPLTASDLRWVLVEATGRILPEVSEGLGAYTLDRLRERQIEIHLETRVTSVEGGRVVLDDGTDFATDTLIWTAGVRPHPLLTVSDLPCDESGRVRCTAALSVDGVDGVWAAGDCASVPDLTRPGALCAPNAQHAVRQARRLADNVVATVRGGRPEPYRHAYVGSVASLGLHKGVAEVYGVRLKGWPAWFMHRTYHMTRMPTLNRKARVVLDWTLALFFRRETVSLGAFAEPRAEFVAASGLSGRAP